MKKKKKTRRYLRKSKKTKSRRRNSRQKGGNGLEKRIKDINNRLFLGAQQLRRPMSILFVCAGNTCRSAFAEHEADNIFKWAINNGSLYLNSAGCRVRSPGTGMAQEARYHVDLGRAECTSHIVKSIDIIMDQLNVFDYIFVMDRGLMDTMNELDPPDPDKIRLLCGDEDVADPYTAPQHQKDFAYATMARQVRQCLLLMMENILGIR